MNGILSTWTSIVKSLATDAIYGRADQMKIIRAPPRKYLMRTVQSITKGF